MDRIAFVTSVLLPTSHCIKYGSDTEGAVRSRLYTILPSFLSNSKVAFPIPELAPVMMVIFFSHCIETWFNGVFNCCLHIKIRAIKNHKRIEPALRRHTPILQ